MSDQQPKPEKKRHTRRRGNGEGSIFQRADGRWVATISNGYADTGKRRRRTIYGMSKKEVQDKLAKLHNAKLDGMLPEATRLTVGAFLDRWLQDAARPRVRPTTHECYEGIIRLHIKPRIGGMCVTKLMPIHVQGLYGEMERDGKSTRMRQLAHAVLHRALKQAVKWGIVPRNVCDAVDPPRVVRKELHPLTTQQALAFMSVAESDRLHAFYVLAITSGLRQGELFGLQWADVDLADKAVMVRRTIYEIKGKLHAGEPKTPKSRRRVELPQLAVDALLSHKKRMLVEGLAAAEWVFCDTEGGLLRRSNMIRKSFKPLLAKAGLPAIRFHDLRHTAATLLLSEGVHPKIVQERLGHSQISLTLDTYSHVLPTMQKDAASRLDGLFTKATQHSEKPESAAG